MAAGLRGTYALAQETVAQRARRKVV